MKQKIKFLLALLFFCYPILFRAEIIKAAEPQRCKLNSSCMVGEFLYDDSYVPITDATCTIVSKAPDASTFLSGAMTIGDNGWYYKSFNAGTLEGTYPTQLCCTAGTDYLCIDKTFIVGPSYNTPEENANAVWEATVSSHTTTGSFGENLQNSVPSAKDIWDYTSRTLSSFGNLASDVWGYSSRSLTSFGTFISDVWGFSTRNLTASTLSSGNVATKSDIDNLVAKIDSNTTLLEKAVNKPIIQTFLEENNSVSLAPKIDKSSQIAGNINSLVALPRINTGNILTGWNGFSTSEIRIQLEAVSSEFDRVNTDDLQWLKDSWDVKSITEIASMTEAIQNNFKTLDSNLTISGKTEINRGRLSEILGYMNKLKNNLGAPADKPGTSSLYAYLNYVKIKANKFDAQSQEIASVLESWDSHSLTDNQKAIDALAEDLSRENNFNSDQNVLGVSTIPLTPQQLKNKALAIQALITTNELLLSQTAGKPVKNLWLEEGSIIFKALVTNPASVAQTVPLKFYLPKELKQENVIKSDPGLSIDYDALESAYYVSGSFYLPANSSKTLSVEVVNIWQISNDEITSLQKQADSLFTPLKGTAYFAQASTLKSDITASLDRASQLQSEAHTPEEKIHAYREAVIEIDKAKSEINDLMTLSSSASSTGLFSGFIGGAQAFSTWGVIVALMVSFVFMTIYTRAALLKLNQPQGNIQTSPPEPKRPSNLWKILGAGLTVLILSGAAFSAYRYSRVSVNLAGPTVAPSPAATPTEINVQKEKEVLGASDTKTALINVPDGITNINVRFYPDMSSPVIGKITEDTNATVLDVNGDWEKVQTDSITGWVNQIFIE